MRANRTLPLAFVVLTTVLAALVAPPAALASGPADHLLFGQQPTDSVAGAVIDPPVTVQVLDIDGNLVTDPVDVTVALSGGDSSATLGGTATQTSVNGVATFDDLTVDKVGTGYLLTASAAGVPDLGSDPFAVSAGPPDHLLFDQQPTDIHAGAEISPAVTVQVFDNQGNLAPDPPVDVTLTLSGGDPDATLGGTTTQTSVNGVATFDDLTVDKVGTGYQLDAASGGLTGDTSASFDVVPGSATHVAFDQQPSDVTAGDAIAPAVTVQILDAHDNLVTDEPADVTLTLSGGDPDGTLGGTTTQTSVNGVATFDDLTVDKAASGYALVAAAAGLTGDTSGTFTVSPAAATQLVFTQQPVNTPANVVMPEIIVTIEDAFGNVATGPRPGKVFMTIAHNPSGGHLGGKTDRIVVDGEAHFTDLVIDKPGTSYTLLASNIRLPGTVSDSFNIKGYTKVTLSASKHLVGAHQPVVLVAHLVACLDGCRLSIYRTPVGGTRSAVVENRPLNSHGNVVVTVRPSQNVDYVAEFAGDGRYRRATSNTVRVNVHLLVGAVLKGAHGTKGGYRLYPYRAVCPKKHQQCPKVEGSVVPVRQVRLTFVLQAASGGHWKTISTTHNTTGSEGTASVIWIYAGPSVKGVPLRTRASFAGDALNEAAVSPWRYFKVI